MRKPTLRILLFFGLAFSVIPAFRMAEPSPFMLTKASLDRDVGAYLRSLDKLKRELFASEETIDNQKVRTAFLEVRDNWKRVEYYISFLDPQYVKDHINGAPLPSVERKVPGISILEPSGMQPLEEALFADQEMDLEGARKRVRELGDRAHILLDNRKALFMTEAKIIAACRIQLLRIATLGITGFDSPVLQRSLEESAISLRTVQQVLLNFSSTFEKADSEEFKDLQNLLSSSIQKMEGAAFDSFDRITFIREQLNPAYQLLGDLHKKSGYEFPHEYQSQISALNYKASSLFANDLLNPYFYTGLTEEIDGPNVRALGRILFFDPILSGNLERSCSSCHDPQLAFTDGRPKSLAIGSISTVDRNAPTLINSVYAERFFYDLRATPLESQFEHVIFNEKEFQSSFSLISERLRSSKEYVERFRSAFADHYSDPINKTTISYALASYVASLRGFNSPVDQFLRGERDTLANEVKIGFNLFMGKAACGTCHFAPTFAGTVPPQYSESESEVLGVPLSPDTADARLDPDPGRFGGVMKDKTEFYRYSFKTLTVRNTALTAPYMHNGVYSNLDQVMDFYNKGGGSGLGMDLPYQTLPFDRLDLTEEEKSQIISFMMALTDTSGLTSRPVKLPVFEGKPEWNSRKVGGLY